MVLRKPSRQVGDLEDVMKKIALVLMLSSGLAACQSSPNQQRVAGGAAIGALGGAAVGALADGGRGALVGAAVGGIGGAAIAGATAPRECTAYDAYGRPYTVQC
jgi:uncharacterized protein YcfJ